jgi:hypothetical protein
MTEVAGLAVHKVCAHEAESALGFKHEAYLEDGVYRWHSNAQVVPDDALGLAIAVGVADATYRATTNAARRTESDAFLARYRSTPHPMSPEARAEARAEFGAGAVIVNVVTGERYEL